MHPGHESDLLRSLHYFGALFLPDQAAVLEESFGAWKSVGVVVERDQSQSPDTSTAELALILHAVRPPEAAVSMEPALHELAFVSNKDEGRDSFNDILNWEVISPTWLHRRTAALPAPSTVHS